MHSLALSQTEFVLLFHNGRESANSADQNSLNEVSAKANNHEGKGGLRRNLYCRLITVVRDESQCYKLI